MKIKVVREFKKLAYTIGKMYLDGVYFCDTLEDAVRPDGVKIYGETAIPAGRYKISLTYSQKFKRVLPYLHNVPRYEGVRIHAGNTAADTYGCILVGENKQRGAVLNSRATENRLMERLRSETQIEIEIN